MGIDILDRLQLFIDYMCLVCFQMKGYVTVLFSKIVKYNEYEHRWYAQLASAIKTNHISWYYRICYLGTINGTFLHTYPIEFQHP